MSGPRPERTLAGPASGDPQNLEQSTTRYRRFVLVCTCLWISPDSHRNAARHRRLGETKCDPLKFGAPQEKPAREYPKAKAESEAGPKGSAKLEGPEEKPKGRSEGRRKAKIGPETV
ncbi:hypothetical protein GCM10023205_66410 [Yinghuangia aomiensis]|uniref:Uncharacterized protein n=1 Tax=Yinghuangia aomiensis TaxID=676205 RepID=A0ABP9I332_9ACTN